MDSIRAEDVELAVAGVLGGACTVAVVFRHRRGAGGLALLAGAAGTGLVLVVLGRSVSVEGLTAGRVVPAALAAAAAVVTLARCRRPGLAAWALVVASAALWSAVPETGTVLVVGAAVSVAAGAVAVLHVVTATRLLAVLGAVLALSAATGLAASDVRSAGAAASLGLLVWWPVGQGLRRLVPALPGAAPGSWLLGAHAVMAGLAARWVGAADGASWGRLAVVAVAGVAVTAAVDPRSR